MNVKKYISGVILLIGIGITAVVSGWFYLQHYLNSSLNLQEEHLFTVPAGTNRQQLAQMIQQQQLISNTSAISWIVRLDSRFRYFKAGTYRLKPSMTLKEMLLLLVSGKEAQFTIQFIEGTRFKDWLTTLNNAPYLKHTIDDLSNDEIAKRLPLENSYSLEGWFYPDSYNYTANTSDITILRRAYEKMKRELASAWNERAADLPYKTPYELLIMASIIEKETGRDSERKKVSSVFVNRLRTGMRLQTDPTVIYGMGDTYQGNIRKVDLQTYTPYNTYLINRLPPTPIAMPASAALEAAAKPDITNYFYFVADGLGGHTFTSSLDQHNKAVSEYLRIMRTKQQ